MTAVQHLTPNNPANAARILAVDDDRALLMLLEERLQQDGYQVVTARNAAAAREILRTEAIDVLLVDREMPDPTGKGVDGLQLVKMLKADPAYAALPIVMQTASDSPEQVQEGIDAGVFYYLTKPLKAGVLSSSVAAAVREARNQQQLKAELSRHKGSFRTIDTCKFIISTLEEAEDLAVFVANCFPSPERALKGIVALLINAVEHGNLGITYKEKTHLLHNQKWRQEIARRQAMPEYADKTVEVIYQCKNNTHYLRVTDQGQGFNWRDYLDIDPARAMDNHGRGIAQANKLSFDTLKFNDVGNQVTAVVVATSPNVADVNTVSTKVEW